MTEQQRLTIRIELARAMGITIEKRWQHATNLTWHLYDVRLPGGTYLGSHCGSIEEAASKLPDPFNSAEDNRTLVEWLAVRKDFTVERFNNEMQKLAPYGFTLSPIESLTASRETITLAAAKALGIETE